MRPGLVALLFVLFTAGCTHSAPQTPRQNPEAMPPMTPEQYQQMQLMMQQMAPLMQQMQPMMRQMQPGMPSPTLTVPGRAPSGSMPSGTTAGQPQNLISTPPQMTPEQEERLRQQMLQELEQQPSMPAIQQPAPQ